jgi:DNA-binding transcriptional regulator YbjK
MSSNREDSGENPVGIHHPGLTRRGQDRRRALIEATLRIIVREGPAAVTHRSVAAEAGATHGSVAYYFGGRDELLHQALECVADQNVRWLQQGELSDTDPTRDIDNVAARLAAMVDQQLIRDRAMGYSVLELHLAAGRDTKLRPLIRAWGKAYVASATPVLEAIGSTDYVRDTRMLAALINGMVLEQLASPRPRFRPDVLEPALRQALTAIASAATAGQLRAP